MKKKLAAILAVLLVLSSCAVETDKAHETVSQTESQSAPPLTTAVEVSEVENETDNETKVGTDEGTVADVSTFANEEADTATDGANGADGSNGADATSADTMSADTMSDAVAGEEEENKVVMHVPKEYIQVYDKLTKSRLTSDDMMLYDEIAVDDMEIFIEDEAVAEGYVASEPSVVAPEYSKTNTQVEDVDEGDIVKTDGEYIYVLRDNELIILSADGASSEKLSSTVVAEGSYTEKDSSFYHTKNQNAKELYIFEDTLAVVLDDYEWYENYSSYSSDYSTLVEFYDVSDPTDPIRKGGFGQEGSYLASRMTDGNVYLITKYSVPYDLERDDYDSYIPCLYEGNKQSFISPSRIVYPDCLHSSSYSVICSYSMRSYIRDCEKAVLGYGDIVYMTDELLYLTKSYYSEELIDRYTESVYNVERYVSGYRTEILKLDLTDGMTVVALGTVKGQPINRFALDEHADTFRIVTTYCPSECTVYTDEAMGFSNTRYESIPQTSGLYVFDSELELLGELSGLAEDERVYSVRFSGDVGYFVTFRQVDPLFAVDLSDPGAPKLMSSLKIPGFSEYLHPYSDGLLFGLGMDADEDTGRTLGMKLSMFDVSDPYDVAERDKLSLDFSYSEALGNPRAILISAEHELIGFPIDSGYVIYGYGDGGFFERSRVESDDMKWSGDSRGLYVGKYIYIVASDCVLVMNMSDLSLAARVGY